jgi:hypothetical protein
MSKSNRPARAGDVFDLNFIRLLGDDEKPQVECFVCNASHKASVIAIFEHRGQSTEVPVCEPCFANRQDDVTRTYLGRPEIRVIDGGEITKEQAVALAERQDAAEH